MKEENHWWETTSGFFIWIKQIAEKKPF